MIRETARLFPPSQEDLGALLGENFQSGYYGSKIYNKYI